MSGAEPRDSEIMDRFEETVSLVTDPITGREIHITTDDSGTHISIPDDIDVGEVFVADGIAAETVVTTTDVCAGFLSKDDSADSGCGMEDVVERARFVESDPNVSALGSDDIGMDPLDPLNPPTFGAAVWPTLEMTKFKSDIVEELSSGESCVALIPDAVQTPSKSGAMSTTPREASIRESDKREQDRLKKKILRANPDYRQKEKERARARMQLRRLDPVYRCNERKRDRQRRKLARLRDVYVRASEREQEKAQLILDNVDGHSVLLPLAGFEDSYAVVETVSKQCQAADSSVLSQFDGT